MTDLNVRPMERRHLEYASSLTQAENWHSETLEEFEGFFSHDPTGCMIVEQDGRPVGIGVATTYQDVGFLGQIVIEPAARGQGLGNKMVAALVSYLRARGVRSICLDATKAGAPLYQRHGFRKAQPSLRYSGRMRGALHPHVRPMRAQDLATVCALDRQWWGADRTFFVTRRWHLHPNLCRVLEQDGVILGYVLARRRGKKLWIGPWGAAARVERPESLLEALAAPDEMAHINAGILASSLRAISAFNNLGLDPVIDPPWRMVWGLDTGLGRGNEMLANGTSAKG